MATEGFICPSEFQPKTVNWMSLCNNTLGPWFINLVWAAIGAIAGFLWHRLRNWRRQKDRLSADNRDYQARKDRLRNLQKALDHEPGSSRSLQLAVVSGLIPEEHANELKNIVLEKASKFEGYDQCHLLKGPKLVQWKVPLSDGADIMDKLNDLAVAGTSIDRSFNLQLDRLRLFHLTDEGVKISNLEDHAHQVPVILQASYAAGYLTIEGLRLNGAVLTASTSTMSTALETKFKKGPSQMEIHRCFIQFPSRQCDEVFVYATKKIDLEGHRDVSVRSLAVPIQQENLRAVLRVGLPSTMLVIYAVKQVWAKFGVHEFVQKSDMNHALAVFSTPVIVFLTQILPQSTEEKVKNWLERGCLVVSTFCFATRTFLSNQEKCAQKLRLPQSIKKVKESGELMSKETIQENSKDRIELHAKELIQTRSMKAPDIPRPILADCLLVHPNQRKSTIPTRDHDNHGYESETESNETMPTLETMSTWEWPAYDAVYDEHGQKQLTKRSAPTPELKDKDCAPFDVVYHHRKGLPWAEQVRVTIYSSRLAKVLAEFLPSKLSSLNAKKRARVWVKDLFHVREALAEKGREFATGASRGDTNMTELHILLGVLLRFMEKEFKETEESYSAMVQHQRASWDMLWAFFPLGEKVVYQCKTSDDEVCGFVDSTEYCFQCNLWLFMVNLTAWDYNGQAWSKHSRQRTITLYEGDRDFTDLSAIRPLRFTEDPAGAEKAFLERGEKFCWLSMLAKERYMEYKGPIFWTRRRGPNSFLVKERANGRVMVDLGSFARMNPGYDMGTAKPSTDLLRNKKVESVDIRETPDRMYAPAIVYGFSFRLKKWGAFSIMGFDHITFNDAAFDALVMDPLRKDLLYQLVSEYIKNNRSNNCNGDQTISTRQVDPIANKGAGCISLCYGPPGTGKTLTAESIAEKLHCPLWSLSVSELGTEPESLESTLLMVFNIAASWGAIVLLDEADVYLQRRTSTSLKRNAMTGIFLRELEYYRGVLFLTTNRVVEFDEAFCSRISMFLHYENHNRETRQTIWTTLLQRLQLQFNDTPVTMGENLLGNNMEDLIVEFSKADFNGREIRNIIQTAVTLAKSKDENLNEHHLRQAWTSLGTSLKELKLVQSPLDKKTSGETLKED